MAKPAATGTVTTKPPVATSSAAGWPVHADTKAAGTKRDSGAAATYIHFSCWRSAPTDRR